MEVVAVLTLRRSVTMVGLWVAWKVTARHLKSIGRNRLSAYS